MLKKYTFLTCLLVLFASLFTNNVQASHAAGGELVYEWLNGSTYRFYFKFYRDCSGSAEPNAVTLCFNNPCTSTSGSRVMTKLTVLPGNLPNGAQVSTGCANQKNTCDSAQSSIPGYREWWYSVDYTLPSACTSWRFSATVPVRNPSANIVGVPNFYVETILNNVDAPGNSSPVFSVKPVPYVCLNQFYNYNNGGVDPNGDSVAFEVVNPLTSSGNCAQNPSNCSFQSASPSLSIPSNPFQTNNTFAVSAASGELGFTPSLLGNHTVSIRANEYRGGVFIGSVMRDIQVQVITCVGTSTTPTISNDPTSVTGSATYSGGTIIGCATKQFGFCFDIKSTDTAAKLVATDNHGIAMPGSTITYTNLQNDSVRACVTWTPAATDTGTRVFVVTAKDSSCASGGVPISYAITVPLYVWAVTTAIKDTTICAGQSVPLNAVGGTQYVWSVVSGGSPISSLSCTNCKSPVASPTVTTSYIVNSNSAQVCGQNTDTLTVTVIQLPNANATSNSPVCPGDTLKLNGTAVTGATAYNWVGPNSFTSTSLSPTIPNAQTINSGFYAFSVTANGCTSQIFNMQVYVGPPAAPGASSNSPLCFGKQLILTASTVSGTTVTYHWSGPNSFTSTQQNPIINNVSFNDSGKYFVYAMKDGCQTFSDSVNIVVNPLPAAPVATFDTVRYCQNVVATNLTATGTNLKWYNVPTGGTGSSTLAPLTTSAGTFKYYVSQTDGNGCEGPRDSVVVVITAKPANPGVTTPVIYCQGATTSQLTATGTNLKWYVVPIGGSPLSSAPTPSSSTPGNSTYFVSQTDGTTGCESDRTPITITIRATPSAPSFLSPISYCVGSPGTPTLGSLVTGTNIQWYTVPTGGTGSSTAPTVNTSVPRIDTYYVSQTLNTCEGVRGMLIVVIQANPAPPQTSDTTYCQFETADTLRAIGQNLLWYTTATGGSGSVTAPVPSTATSGVFKFYVSQTVSGCESQRDSIEVTVYAKPQPPVGDDDSVCQYSTSVAITATGTNLKWYDTAVGGIALAAAPLPDTDTPGTYFWYVSQSINGCESDRDTVEIEVVALPAQPTSDTVEYCLGGIAQPLTAVGQNLLWYYTPTGGIPTAIAPTPVTTVAGVFNYYVSQTVNNCEGPRDTLTVIVDTFVSVNIIVSDKYFCLTDSIEVSQTGKMPDTSNFAWTWDGADIISGDSSGPYILKWNTAGTKTITLFADNNGCKAYDTNTVEVLPLPESYFNMASEICVGQPLTMELDSILKYVAKYSYKWSAETNVIALRSGGGFTMSWPTVGQQIITQTTYSDSGCVSLPFSDTVNVRNDPDAKIEQPDNSTICTKTEIVLKAISLTGGFHKYEWTPEQNFLTNKSSEVVARIQSSGYMKLMVTDEFGCTGEDSIYLAVKLCCKAILPSAFSPNNDGRNDKFGIISSGTYKISAFRIVNRYGREVFSTKNQHDRWDGTYNGEPQDLGTYYYYIKYSCEDDDADNEVEERGDVTLVR